jgi:glutamyl-tRNA reductase
VTRGIVEVAMKQRAYEPLFIVDLAVPRDVEASVSELEDVFLYTVDDLEHVVKNNLRLRHEAAAQAEEMIHIQVQEYMEWLKIQGSGVTIAEFRARGEQLRADTLKKAQERLARGEDASAVLEMLAHTLTNKLLHHPTAQLRQRGGDEAYVRMARTLLGLDEQP